MVLFFKEEKISSNLFVKFSNIFFTHSSTALVGESSLTSVDLFVTKDTTNLTFLWERQQPIIEVQKVNK